MIFVCQGDGALRDLHSFPTRRSSDLPRPFPQMTVLENLMLVPLRQAGERFWNNWGRAGRVRRQERLRSEEHTSELQSRENLVCRLLLEKNNYYRGLLDILWPLDTLPF